MDLLDKFNRVEIKADDRISDSDRSYCEAQQEAYEKALAVWRQIAGIAKTAQEEQARILNFKEDETYNSFLGSKYDFSEDTFTKLLDETQSKFVCRIVEYFAHKYHVTLDDAEIYDAFMQKKPEEPSSLRAYFYTSPREWPEETRKKYEAEKSAYEQAVEEVQRHNRELIIRYDQVVDRIFLQLGGGSFRDTAILELKDACHAACWNSHSGQPRFEQNKAVIRYFYGCDVDYFHEKYKGRGEESEFQLYNEMKDILKALNYYELGTQSYTISGISDLCGYRTFGADHPINGEKVTGVKLYKNNRVDIRFSSEAYAREFVEQFIGTVA